jgi:hypothetical protein
MEMVWLLGPSDPRNTGLLPPLEKGGIFGGQMDLKANAEVSFVNGTVTTTGSFTLVLFWQVT